MSRLQQGAPSAPQKAAPTETSSVAQPPNAAAALKAIDEALTEEPRELDIAQLRADWNAAATAAAKLAATDAETEGRLAELMGRLERRPPKPREDCAICGCGDPCCSIGPMTRRGPCCER